MMLLLLNFFAILLIFVDASRIPLTNRDAGLPSSLRFEARMRRDALRVASLSGKPTDIRIEVYGYAQYFATIGVGSPAVNQTLVIDTGSDLVWVKCDSCVTCYNPAKSSSLQSVTCDSDSCQKIDKENRGCDNLNNCTYNYEYADGSYTKGSLVLETIAIGSTSITNVPMGCSQTSEMTSSISIDGILGLGGGSLSLVSQSGGQIGGAFSYCLNDSTGWLNFGRSTFPTNASWASMIRNPKNPSFYYIDLLSIEVGREMVDIPGEVFKIDDKTGDGGVIIDSGTTVTYLPDAAYVLLRDKFKEKFGNLLNPTDPQLNFDTCYSLNGVNLDPEQIPIVSSIISSNGMSLQNIVVDASNVLFNIDDISTCFAFVPIETSRSIIGVTQQEGIQITIDASNGYVGFGPGC